MATEEEISLKEKWEEKTGVRAKQGEEPTEDYKEWRIEREEHSKESLAEPEETGKKFSERLKSFKNRRNLVLGKSENPISSLTEPELSPEILRREETKVPRTTGPLKRQEEVEIITNGNGQPFYKVKLPELTDRERGLVGEVKDRAIDEIEIDPNAITDPKEREVVFTREVKKMLMRESGGMNLSPKRADELTRIIVRDMIGFGPLDVLLDDPLLEDILVTGTQEPVYVFHKDHGMCETNIYFDSDEQVMHYIEKMGRRIGRRIDQQNPLLDARLLDGSRVNATIPPISLNGPTISIRKFRSDPLTIVDLIELGTLTTDVAGFLWLIVEGLSIKPANIIYAGGTASGKTTTMNAATAFIPNSDRIISMEDTAELQLPHRHWVRLETRPPNIEGRGEVTMEDLVKNALRMRPDRIIVGEVRGPEAMTMFTGMNTGHDGCSGTLHANSAMETITRLTEPPMNVPNIMIPALDIIVMQRRMYRHGEGQVRRITEISEVTGLETKKPQLSRIYKWNAKDDRLEPTGVPIQIKSIIAEYAGIDGEDIEIELERRSAVIEWMRHKGIKNVYEVGELIQDYYQDPQEILEKVQSDIPGLGM